MISHYFNIERSIGSVYTLSGAQATLHAVYHHAMHYMPYYHPIIQFHPQPTSYIKICIQLILQQFHLAQLTIYKRKAPKSILFHFFTHTTL